MMIDAATQTMLTSGSIWSRETPEGETQVTVLFITNLTLSKEAQEKNPPQVVFLTGSFKVQSMTIEKFVKNRNYVTMNEHVETLVNALTAPIEDEEDDEDAIDIDAIPLPEASGGEAVELDLGAQPDAATGEVYESTGALLATQAAAQPSREPVFKVIIEEDPELAALLTERFISYSESMAPNGTGDTLHTLRFGLSPKLGLDTLNRAFGLDGPVTTFTINSAVAPTQVDIDGFVQTFLEVVTPMGNFPSQSYALVQVTSRGDIRSKQEVIQTPQPAAAPAVSLSPDLTPEQTMPTGLAPQAPASFLEVAAQTLAPQTAAGGDATVAAEQSTQEAFVITAG